MLRIGERSSGVMFCLQCRQSGPHEFLRLKVLLRPRDRCLSRGVFGRSGAGDAGCLRCGDGLAGIAHLLHGRSAAATK